jgi:hypothetical protein
MILYIISNISYIEHIKIISKINSKTIKLKNTINTQHIIKLKVKSETNT